MFKFVCVIAVCGVVALARPNDPPYYSTANTPAYPGLSRPSPINPDVVNESKPKSYPSVILKKDAPVPAAASIKVKRDDHHGPSDNHNQNHGQHQDQHHDQHQDNHHGGHHKREAFSDAPKTNDKKGTPTFVAPVPKQAHVESGKPKRETPLLQNSAASKESVPQTANKRDQISKLSTNTGRLPSGVVGGSASKVNPAGEKNAKPQVPAAASIKVKRDDHHGRNDNHNQQHDQHQNQHHDQHQDNHHGGHHKREALSDAPKTDDKKGTPTFVAPVPKQAHVESGKPKRETPLLQNSAASKESVPQTANKRDQISKLSTNTGRLPSGVVGGSASKVNPAGEKNAKPQVPAAASIKVKRDDHHGRNDNHNQQHDQHQNQHHDQHHDDKHGGHHKREALSDAPKTDDKKETPTFVAPVPKQAHVESGKPKRETPLPINSGSTVHDYRANSANNNNRLSKPNENHASVNDPATTAKSIAKDGEPVPPVPLVHNADNTKFASQQRPAREAPVASDNKDTKRPAVAHKPLKSDNSNIQTPHN